MLKRILEGPQNKAINSTFSIRMLYYSYLIGMVAAFCLIGIYLIALLTYDGSGTLYSYPIELVWIPISEGLVIFFTLCFCLYLLFLDKAETSTRIFLSMVTLLMYIPPFVTDAGFYDPVLSFVFLTLVFAAVFLTRVDLIIFTSIYLVMITLFFVGHNAGWIVGVFEPPGLDRLLVQYAAVIVTSIVLQITVRQIMLGADHLRSLNLELEIYRDRLEDLVFDRTRKLNEERDKAQEANRAKSKFLANMSHELRTPLNAIIGYSEMLEEELAGMGDAQHLADDALRIEYSGRHLLGLINNVLDISKIEAQKTVINVDQIELDQLIEEVLITIKPLIDTSSNIFAIENSLGHFILQTDYQKLKQILINLLSNAFKFTSDGDITLHVRLSKNLSEHIEFSVEDTGIGIPSEFMDKLFKPFDQGDNSVSRRFDGTGLGLALSKRFAECLGGEIFVDSCLDQGSKFTLKVPVHLSEPVQIR
ncbi:MAG: ATP-binding protein [Chloroflexota bacterium]